MPFYRFQLISPLSESSVMERLQFLTRPKRTFWESIRHAFRRAGTAWPPFIGTVDRNRFRVYRDIRYRNSFLPVVSRRVEPTSDGARISVVMYLHPLVALFMLFWLSAVAIGGSAAYAKQGLAAAGFSAAMFAFGVALTCGGFFPEAFKAKKLLQDGINGDLAPNGQPASSFDAPAA
jgi:hypothetical protein